VLTPSLCKNGLSAFFKRSSDLLSGLAGKVNGIWHSYRITRHRGALRIDPDYTKHLTSLLSSTAGYAPNSSLSLEDEQIGSNIEQETSTLNRNNLTRTNAYWAVFNKYPELHWAFLAHMVSRNGGWSMTDLKGQWLPQLQNQKHTADIFKLLESCNSLIFGDAYPQLRLYIESKRIGRSLFGLLPRFGVSSFMIPFWNRFWMDGNPVPLTEALIINEQHFIQLRVVEDAYYKRNVLDTLSFRSQPWLQLNQIVFPLWPKAQHGQGVPMRLVGRVLERFEDLDERIRFGISLYGILFGYSDVLQRTTAFASHVSHSGSRADYWPHRFTSVLTPKADSESDRSDIAAGPVRPGIWLSPTLSEAWMDQAIHPAKKGDWFQSMDVISYLQPPKPPRIIDMTHEHLFGQNKLQAAVLLERSFKNGASNRRTGRG